MTFSGFHTFKHDNNIAQNFIWGGYIFEPLDVIESKFIKRLKIESKVETISIQFMSVSTGDDLYYPIFSDGVLGGWRNSSIQVVGRSTASQSYNFKENLRDVVVSSGTIDVKITSTREVYNGN